METFLPLFTFFRILYLMQQKVVNTVPSSLILNPAEVFCHDELENERHA